MVYHVRKPKPDFSEIEEKMRARGSAPAQPIDETPDSDFSYVKYYSYEELLGRGAQGQVWLAHEQTYDGSRLLGSKPLAIKFMFSLNSPGGLESMLSEADIVPKFDHENVIQASPLLMLPFNNLPEHAKTHIARDAQSKGMDPRALKIPAMPMQYVEGFKFGSDLKSWLDRLYHMRSTYSMLSPQGKLNQQVAHAINIQTGAFVASRVARALEYIHEDFKKVHKDVKPANILINKKGVVKLTDFALCDFKAAGKVCGTPYYMSPEQIRGLPLTGKSDVYSLGIVLYETITSAVPWLLPENPADPAPALHGSTLLAQIVERAEKGFRPKNNSNPNDKGYFCDPEMYGLREIDTPQGPKIKEGVCSILRRMLDPNPENRLTSGETASALEGVIYGFGFGPTNNSLAAHGALFEDEPMTLAGITPQQLKHLRYTCKDPAGTFKFANSLKKGPITFTEETMPCLARPHLSIYSERIPRKLVAAQTIAVQKAHKTMEAQAVKS